MKWITRKNAKVDRVACPWLIQKFIDPQPEFIYVDKERVLEEASRLNAISYDAPNAKYTHRDGLCTFEVLIQEYKLRDSALDQLAKIVHGADVEGDVSITAESAGLLRIAKGFAATTPDDHEKLRLQFPIYDALYASLR
jgi:hypothetical protein